MYRPSKIVAKTFDLNQILICFFFIFKHQYTLIFQRQNKYDSKEYENKVGSHKQQSSVWWPIETWPGWCNQC